MQVQQRQSTIKSFSQALITVRIEQGLSHRDVADRCGKAKQLVKDWEDGIAIPNTQTLKRLYSTFPKLRHFTHLLPAVEIHRYGKRAMDAMDAIGMALEKPGEAQALPGWYPPMSSDKEELPPELKYPPRPKTFSENLRYLRLKEGMDQGDVGELLGVTSGAVGHWEKGTNLPILDHFTKLLQLFPALKDGPQPETRDIMKPDNRVNGYTAVPPLRAVPTAFDQIVNATPPPPPPPPLPVAPVASEKSPQEKLAEAGMAYAKLVSEKKQWESEVLEHEIEVEEATKKLDEAKKKLDEISKSTDAAHQKILDLASSF